MRPVTALGGDAAVDVKIGTYRIAERFDVALASVAVRRGRDADVAFAATAAGLPLPAPARAASLERFGAFWVTPEMWFVEAPMVVHDDLARDLKTIFSDAASVTEQTDAWVRFDVSALDLSPLFERLSNVDLAAAPVGFASRTVIDHLGCYLIKRAAGEVTLYGPRSSAASLLHALEVAATSVA